MTLTIELPDDLASLPNAAQIVLEAVAVEAYRTGGMTKSEAAALVGAGRIEFDGVLKKHNVTFDAYDVEDLMNDIATSDKLRAQGLLPPFPDKDKV